MLLRPFPRTILCALLTYHVASAADVKPFPDGETITLEQAYDRALETDQSVRIAYFQVRKANLLPWSALTRLGPQISASGQYSRSERANRSTVNEISVGPGLDSLSRSVERTSHSRSGFGEAGFSVQQPLIDFTVFGITP